MASGASPASGLVVAEGANNANPTMRLGAPVQITPEQAKQFEQMRAEQR